MRTTRQLLWPFPQKTTPVAWSRLAFWYGVGLPDAPSTRMLLQQPDGEPPTTWQSRTEWEGLNEA